MIGENTITLNYATVKEAVQDYLSKMFACTVTVKEVKAGGTGGFGNVCEWSVTFEGREEP